VNKSVRLILVSVNDGKTQQSNKYYNMKENGDGTFTVEYGRVGADRPAFKTYSMSEWDKTYRAKTKKGYRDVTDLLAESSVSAAPMVISDSSEVRKFMQDIQGYSSQSVKTNYNVSFENVTQTMIDEAQGFINHISGLVRVGASIDDLNKHLLDLFHVIPRKMSDVRSHLFRPIIDNRSLEYAQSLIGNEQDTLDSMAGQVSAFEKTDGDKADLLTSLGLSVSLVEDSKVIATIKKWMGQKVSHMVRAFEVINHGTQRKYDGFKEREPNEALLWHGSRNQNWFSIIQSGLMIRPSGAVHTGSMFGDSIYGANQCRKAMNYTSLRGSYWSGGSSDRAFMALFNFKLGKQKHITHHTSDCYSLSWNRINGQGFDSVYAHGGADLINDEFCVYRTDQCTIKYMIELKA
jgi:poly [ADP-ribose] polymerase 2/3/4